MSAPNLVYLLVTWATPPHAVTTSVPPKRWPVAMGQKCIWPSARIKFSSTMERASLCASMLPIRCVPFQTMYSSTNTASVISSTSFVFALVIQFRKINFPLDGSRGQHSKNSLRFLAQHRFFSNA